MAYFTLNLHMFGDGAGASAAPAAGTGDGGEAAVVQPGQLDDGTVVDNRLAARMEAQAKKRRARGEAPVMQAAQTAAEEKQENAPEAQPEKSLDEEWTEAKKGKYKEQYARDVQAAIQDRFKNQADANEQLKKLQPALDVLMKKAGVEDIDEFVNAIMDDDSLYEEEAEEMGMPVEAYKNFKKLQDEHDRRIEEDQRQQEEMFMRQHFQNLAQQGEEMKKIYPDFDLRREMENETFRRLVAPNSGLKVSDAFFAVHHAELEPQAMAYGYQRAQQQISNTLQANRARPVEGPLKKGQSANVAIDPKAMSRKERENLIERARRGEKIIF
ncbi:MAG: hypothetical protein K6F61_05055 [Clostridiales bacterium]|nr:hypothetical protein [Clostridiales bacterium]